MDPDDHGYFLCRVFDRWRNNDFGRFLVNHFETLVSQHIGQGSQLCIYSKFCGKGVAVEHDGSVYACDPYVYPEYRLGNLKDNPLGNQAFSRTQVQFGYAKNETLTLWRAIAHRHLQRRAHGQGEAGRLDGHQHEGRLETHLALRNLRQVIRVLTESVRAAE